ncbi:hypothetical protein E2C01_091644 [Portunus trituberculatus]|uniref:Uncharacterized protein n=1 Tax=Portunus trituberculatus TaxID=210409 RepID=A0A5B7JP56_PORTR|nr:hypothetical protein [Portunus trituberculatus]
MIYVPLHHFSSRHMMYGTLAKYVTPGLEALTGCLLPLRTHTSTPGTSTKPSRQHLLASVSINWSSLIASPSLRTAYFSSPLPSIHSLHSRLVRIKNSHSA